jgi:hypothetical protein
LQLPKLKYTRIRCFKSSKLHTSFNERRKLTNIEFGNSATFFSAARHIESLCRFGLRHAASTPTPIQGPLSLLPFAVERPPSIPPAMDKSQPHDPGFWRRKLSQTVRDLVRDLRDCSFLTWALRADLDCSSSNALSLRAAALGRAEEDGWGRKGRWRRSEEDARGVCLEEVKNWGQGEWNLGMWEGRFGVLKFEMSLRREDDETYGDVDRNGGSSPSIFV